MRSSDEIDSSEWARLLDRLLRAADLTPEKAAQPAGPVPASWGTIRKWLKQEQGVTAKSVRDVVRALGYPPARALVEVGFMTPNEVGVTGLAAPPSPTSDALVRKIAAALADDQIPPKIRTTLRKLVSAAFDGWLDMYQARPVREPAARDRRARAS